MRRRNIITVSIVTIGLGILLTALGGIFRVTRTFYGSDSSRYLTGELLLPVEAVERVVVRPHQPPRWLESKWGAYDLPPAKIPFQNEATRAFLDAETTYDIACLPFGLRVDEVLVLSRPEPRDTLTVTEPHAEHTREIRAGTRLELEDGLLRVETIRKWSGLIRVPKGCPMAAVALRRDEEPWTEHLFLAAREWLSVEPGVELHLSWHDSERAARDAQGRGLDALDAARWGVVDGETVNWFTSFVRGAGIDLADGSSVILLERDDAHRFPDGPAPAIRVGVVERDRKRARWVPVNQRRDDALVRYEDPTRRETVLVFYAWRDGCSLLSPYYRGEACGSQALNEGESRRPGGFPYAVRLDQIMATAAALPLDDSPLYEAVLEAPERELHLRQGETVSWGDVRLQFQRVAPPPAVRYKLTVMPPPAGKPSGFTLGPKETVRYCGWNFSQGIPDHNAEQMAVLRVERVPGLRLLTTENWQLATDNWQLTTDNWQLTTDN